MFDPTAVRSNPKIVPDRNGLYTFRGTYDGPVEFFRGQPIKASAIWTSEADVVEVEHINLGDTPGHDVVEGWNLNDRPGVFGLRGRPNIDES